MKRKFFQLGGVLIMTGALLFSVNLAKATDETGNKWINDTICCKNGSTVAFSSDCMRGEGSCLDNTCPAGSVEKGAGTSCSGTGGGGDE